MSITDELNQIANQMGRPNLVSEKTSATSELQNAYQNYSAEKEAAKSRIFNDPTINQLGQYEQQVTQQLFAEPTSYLSDMSNPDSENYVADPMARLNFATSRQGTVISKLLGIKKSIEKRKGDLQDLLNAWTEEYEMKIAEKKLAKEEIDDAFQLAWDIMTEQQRRTEKQQELKLDDLKKQQTKTEETAQIWNELYSNADSEDDIWKAIDANQSAWRAQGIDVDKLWQWQSELGKKVGYGGKIEKAGSKTTKPSARDSALDAVATLENLYGRGNGENVGTDKDLSRGPSILSRLPELLGKAGRAVGAESKLVEDFNMYNNQLKLLAGLFTQAFGSGTPQEAEAKRLMESAPNFTSTDAEAKSWFDSVRALLGGEADVWEDTGRREQR